ncbi:competence protein [Aestuariivirga sp.]|uniref:competence protein n=1 Tax=Aestuariivirga sp. TaxID=2650926 RepID=UPI0039190CF2
MLSKCGEVRVHHWAHHARRHCDRWWEPETDWHREWKNHFPMEWQEVIHHNPDGERHVADVRTGNGLVIEFQHSHLSPAERRKRETSYGNMVWVVDGARLSGDRPRFINGVRTLQATGLRGFCAHLDPQDCFPKNWVNSSKLVLFDFGRDPENVSSNDTVSNLWCLLPGRADGRVIFGALPRSEFVRLAIERPYILQAEKIVTLLDQHYRDLRLQRAQAMMQSYQKVSTTSRHPLWNMRWRRKRWRRW